MPVYYYRCDMIHCNKQFQVKHSMSEKLINCPICATKGSLTRMPPPFQIKKPEIHITGKPGEVVEEFIVLSKEQMSNSRDFAASNQNAVDPSKYKKKKR